MQGRVVKATRLDPHWSCGSVPLLVIDARRHPFKPPALWSELRGRVGDGVTTGVIDDASHTLFPEQPDAVAEAVLRWIARL